MRHFTLRERKRLLIDTAANLARERRARGLRLSLPEGAAVVASPLLQGLRDGRSVPDLVPDLMEAGRNVLTREDVVDRALELPKAVRVEATFLDGTKLVTVTGPIL